MQSRPRWTESSCERCGCDCGIDSRRVDWPRVHRRPGARLPPHWRAGSGGPVRAGDREPLGRPRMYCD
eukprot:1869155-Alexandrium_andersonii.AAC.1